MSTLAAALLSLLPRAVADEPPPETDIYVVDLDPKSRRVGKPHNVTPRRGYDNQPAFLLDDSALLFVAAEGAGPTDVFRFDFATGVTTQVTATPEAEFSPTPLASGFSVVRVGAPTGDTEAYTESQGLWRYDGADKIPLFPAIRRVGYHTWLDERHVALVIVGPTASPPHALVMVDVATGVQTPLAPDVGRSLGHTPDGKRVSFVDKHVADRWTVSAIAAGETATELIATPPLPDRDSAVDPSEDFCWLPDGSLLMAVGTRLLRWDGASGGAWVQLAAFPELRGDIKRIAVSHDGRRIAFVLQTPVPMPEVPHTTRGEAP
ncbi:hypothetical protein LBMAG42_10750 [Deltaproteobacteria bacterium]|nr:hypothetical protein LBMAG42_10750 [Deltaproteobacteria bacterium]